MTAPDPSVLAAQLRHPDGAMGLEVAKRMVEFNAGPNAFVIENLHLDPTDSVLEIGFGPGEALAEVAHLTPKGFVAGLDHSETMLSMASERNKRAIVQDRIELQLGQASAIPYRDEMFHKVFAVNVAHFWADPVIEMKEIHRVLKKGGSVVLFLPRPEKWPPGVAETGVFHIRTPAEVEECLQKAGFTSTKTVARSFGAFEGHCVIGTK